MKAMVFMTRRGRIRNVKGIDGFAYIRTNKNNKQIEDQCKRISDLFMRSNLRNQHIKALTSECCVVAMVCKLRKERIERVINAAYHLIESRKAVRAA